MTTGVAVYAYKHGFSTKEGSKKRPKIGIWRGALFSLIIDGCIEYGKHDEDLYISLIQYLQTKGYDFSFATDGSISQIRKFFMDALFSYCPFHFENCRINGKFRLSEFRAQFNTMEEIELKITPYYRNRNSMPLPYGMSVSKIKSLIFQGRDFYNKKYETLLFPFNSHYKDAIWIMKREIIVDKYKNQIRYKITYSFEKDAKNFFSGNGSYSSWEINIYAEPNENYIDFLIALYDNYIAILSGDKAVLKTMQESEPEKWFYLGGNFTINREKDAQID